MQETSPIKESFPGQVIPAPSLDSLANAAFQRQMGHISRHSLVFFFGTMFTAAAGYLFKVYLARELGAEALGIYALGMTITGLLGVFNAFGLPQSAVRFVAAYCATGRVELLRRFIARCISLLLISNLLLGGLLLLIGPVIAVRFYHTPALGKYFGLFAMIMLLGVLTTFLGQVLAGYKDVMRRTVITNFIGTPLTMVLTVSLVMLGLGLRGYILAQVLGASAMLVLLTVSVVKLTPAGQSLMISMLSPLENQVASFSTFALGVGLLEFVMAQSDKVLIGVYLSARDVGVYAVAMALVSFVAIVLQSVNQIFSPIIADLYSRSEHAMLARIFQTLTKWSLGLTLPLAAVMIIFAPVLMRIFGPDFEIGWPILVIGTVGQLVNCGVGSVGYLLLMSGHQRDLIRIQSVMAIVMVAIGILLIPRWGVVGAAAAATITNLLSNLWYLREVRRKLEMSPYNMSYFRMLLPLAGMVSVLFLEHRLLLGIFSGWLLAGTALVAGYGTFTGLALVSGLNADDRIIRDAIWAKIGGKVSLRGAGA
jgi:O-antigen/teichoic acid export membrane protein